MGLTVADVVELPKPKRVRFVSDKKQMGKDGIIHTIEENISYSHDAEIYNDLLSEIASLPLSPEKVVGMVSISQEAVEQALNDWLSYWESKLTPDDVKEIAQAMVSNKSKILGLKGKHDTNSKS